MDVMATHHVLVIDDADDLRALFRDILEGEGYRATLAATPPGIEDIVRLGPGLVILDLLLGSDEAAAHDLLVAMRGDERLRSVPVILCSAATGRIDDLRAELDALGTVIIPKPFELDAFLSTVTTCLAVSRDRSSGRP